MSRPVAHPDRGIVALRAAVAEIRSEQRGRTARAALTSRDLVDGGQLPSFHISSPGRLTAAAASALPATALPATVGVASPASSTSNHLVEHAAPEGDVAVAIGLVQRAQAGDAEAFGELYDLYLDQVYRYILYRVPTSQLAEDLTSETFLRALRRISSFTWQGRDVGAWFVTIARNLIADHYKSGRYRLELSTDDVAGSGSAPTVDGPEIAVLESMQNKVLLEAVKQLGAEQQECIVLRFLQGLSVAETAQVMGKNDGAIKALQYRAIRTLGRILPEGVEL